MIPQNKKTPEELAALRNELGTQQHFAENEPAPPTPNTPKKPKRRKIHPLRKEELPLAPAQGTHHKIELPSHRKSAQSLAESNKRETISVMSNPAADPAAYLKKLTAHPILLTPTYILALCAGLAAWQRALYITPLSLIIISTLLTIFIFVKKKRSRHHAAILTIIIIMTLVFGGITYAPLFSYAS